VPKAFKLGGHVSLETLELAADGGLRLVLGSAEAARMKAARQSLMRLAAQGEAVYGLNTGFGDLASKRIPIEDARTLQNNLVRSHASGVGEPLAAREAKAMLFLKANELARGHSGVRPTVVEAMAALYHSKLAPRIPSQGSVGASGDLAPLAHLALFLIGEGEGKAAAMRKAGLEPLALDLKEGLSLVNGTQAMQSVGGLSLLSCLRILDAADRAAALSLEALKGTPDPYREEIHRLKAHPGQLETAASLWKQLEGSEIRESHRSHDARVQDSYSLRCAPQVHGTARDALAYARRAVETETASVTDNPIVYGGRAYSGGNFHGQPIAAAFDFACIGLAALGNISERRIFHVVCDSTAVQPPFLAKRPGLESGWMIPQYVAAALASENKTLAHPASADTIPTCGNKEDHVSMGMWGAQKLKRAAGNAARIVAIELLAGTQGVEHHAPLKPGRGVRDTMSIVRSLAAPANGDEPLSERIETVASAILEGAFER
jgi:histidine ammonia-lyase